jgi:hypothetical protein
VRYIARQKAHLSLSAWGLAGVIRLEDQQRDAFGVSAGHGVVSVAQSDVEKADRPSVVARTGPPFRVRPPVVRNRVSTLLPQGLSPSIAIARRSAYHRIKIGQTKRGEGWAADTTEWTIEH